MKLYVWLKRDSVPAYNTVCVETHIIPSIKTPL